MIALAKGAQREIEDIRSSYYPEDVATEFQLQG